MSTKRAGKVNEQQGNSRKRRKASAAASEAISAVSKEEPAPPVVIPEPVLTPSALQEAVKTEFVCTVCLDIAIKAHGLSCSHLFCEYCIKHWLEKNTKCPFCREDTRRDRPVPISAVDRVIEKYFESQPDCAKDERSKNVEERAKMVSEMVAARPPRPVPRHRLSGFESDSSMSDLSVQSWGPAHALFSNIQGYFDRHSDDSFSDSDFSLSDSETDSEVPPPLEEVELDSGSFLDEDSDDSAESDESELSTDSEAPELPHLEFHGEPRLDQISGQIDSPRMVVGVYSSGSSRTLQEVIFDSLRMIRSQSANTGNGNRAITDGRQAGERSASNRSNNRGVRHGSRSRVNNNNENDGPGDDSHRDQTSSPTNVVELPTLRRSQRTRQGGRREGASSRRGFNLERD